MKRSIFLSTVLIAFIALIVTACSSSCKNSGTKEGSPGVVATPASIVANSDAPDPSFLSYDDAVRKAKSDHKLVLADVYTDWCVWCKKMDKEVYPDDKVKAEIAKYFEPVKLNAESNTMRTYRGGQNSEQQIANAWGVDAFPTIVLLSGDEKVIQKIPGYQNADQFALVLRYFGSGAYQTNPNFEDWKKTQS